MDKNKERSEEFKVYKRRYAILVTVILLNISNAAIWMTYSPVATTAANYYGVDPGKINWFSLSFMIVTIPFAFLTPLFIDKFGLKYGMYFGAIMNCFGAIIRAIGTSGLFSRDAEYTVSLIGQVFSASSQGFVLFIPTKVSQVWFPEYQRAIATTVSAMSNPLGILLAQGLVPVIIQNNEDNIPLNNYVWMAVSLISLVATLFSVTRGKPKTPPSLSAEKEDGNRPPFLQQLKMCFSTVPYIFLLLTLGCGVGIFSTVATLTQQILCPLGYSDVFSGLSNVLMILFGFLGAAISGIIADKTKLFEEITKITFGGATVGLILLFEFFLVPDYKAAILVSAALFGLFGIGSYPVGLELAVEVTYPIEESVSSAFIFLSGQIQAIIAIAMIPALATEQSAAYTHLNVCESDTTSNSKDYTIPLLVILIYMTTIVSMMIIFLKAKYKRLEVEAKKHKIVEASTESDQSVDADNISTKL